ncbi:hypothetical protein GLOIN_2v1784076 [Rhizophagus irregularis DAOM 181602=DAOM 197198]|uniref:Uncharacterized protein n=1 Tax=Rhizophagus irregularis (strain DAOM 181602 / DAOM 197198 / MUCL 43194) TaxID=747089 RepID=A0A2P4PDF6_RHIID|nr:hypothetical protein GLOIN_2v1784076 [Rhizophagus irregularis DAOM 181602=DAOM 197198]POG63428.1 hypothetical protein GLOIN_2v1784076 [Rhizophagus irregularis DAOM 181602=DAOM 197198]GBC47026.2 hypothetical protein GLOIN_2v1784076 [Rhizophagus irregularis DAOM 181602=DAOM 197198]|eukprot:XP_025170294.1 hypothetical protein GLOIN_2v1784076 [Rhizophagus irregularis DAOM 181602=DAOM 197198]
MTEFYLNDFKGILSSEFKELKGVRLHNIIFWGNDNIPIRPGTEFQSLAEETTDENRSKYLFKVTSIYGQKYGKREIPYTSGSFDQLEALAREFFGDLEEGTFIFDWNLKAVFKDILRRQTYGSLANMQKFYMKEYAPLDPPFTGEECGKTVEWDYGSHGYGPIDYWVIFVDILLLLCEAKSQDMDQGVAQVIRSDVECN